MKSMLSEPGSDEGSRKAFLPKQERGHSFLSWDGIQQVPDCHK